MLRQLLLKDFVLVRELELDFESGFTVLTGETGAGKSILIDALQCALGARADAGVVREGASRAEVSAEFDAPPTLQPWLCESGFLADDEDADAQDGSVAAPTLLLRRTIDAQGRSRAWINGSVATATQLREAASQLLEIHGQHAWQSLTQPAAVRALLDARIGRDTAPLAAAWSAWRAARRAVDEAGARSQELARERERLQWQLGELDALAPGDAEWDELNAEHTRLSHAQSLIEASRDALERLSEGDVAADALTGQAADALDDVGRFDPALAAVAQELRSIQAQLQDAARTLQGYLGHHEPDPQRLASLDDRLGTWVRLARRHRQPPQELPALRQRWRDELNQLEAAADTEALARQEAGAARAYREEAALVSRARQAAAPLLAAAVTQAMQSLGMEGGRFEVALLPLEEPQSWGLEQVELRVAGHAGATPRPLAKVASGGELSRLALAIAVTTARERQATGAVATLIFDEIDAGVGGAVGDGVGRLLRQLGCDTQVLAVTHLAQVASCANQHLVVAKRSEGGATLSQVHPVRGEARVAEVARMLGGERLTDTSRAHAEAMLGGGT
jgi:DNA repair protein RecN (Recombination protein N)